MLNNREEVGNELERLFQAVFTKVFTPSAESTAIFDEFCALSKICVRLYPRDYNQQQWLGYEFAVRATIEGSTILGIATELKVEENGIIDFKEVERQFVICLLLAGTPREAFEIMEGMDQNLLVESECFAEKVRQEHLSQDTLSPEEPMGQEVELHTTQKTVLPELIYDFVKWGFRISGGKQNEAYIVVTGSIKRIFVSLFFQFLKEELGRRASSGFKTQHMGNLFNRWFKNTGILMAMPREKGSPHQFSYKFLNVEAIPGVYERGPNTKVMQKKLAASQDEVPAAISTPVPLSTLPSEFSEPEPEPRPFDVSAYPEFAEKAVVEEERMTPVQGRSSVLEGLEGYREQIRNFIKRIKKDVEIRGGEKVCCERRVKTLETELQATRNELTGISEEMAKLRAMITQLTKVLEEAS